MTCKHGLSGGCSACYLERRDRFAAAALTGLLANPGRIGSLREAVEAASDAADLQIAALDKGDEHGKA